MTPDLSEYDSFGRNTKLLLHPRDIPDLQFRSKAENKGEIPPETEVSVAEMVRIMDKEEEGGEISPLLQETVKLSDFNSSHKYIVETADNQKKCGEIPPKAVEGKGKDRLCEKQAWFQKPVKCVSKWSQALKMGVMYSMGRHNKHTASMDSVENDKLSFSFFL